MSGPAHVLVLRPIIERLRAQGHEVLITARVYTQTLELLDLHGMEYTLIGRHGGASRVRKLMRLIQRTSGMRRFGSGAGFDLSIAHGSNDIAIASRMLGIPEANMHDYEFAVAQHHVGCRLAKRVIFPGLGAARAAEAIRRRPRRSSSSTRGSRRSTTCTTSSRTRAPSSGWVSTPSGSWSWFARLPTSRSITAARTPSSRRCSRG